MKANELLDAIGLIKDDYVNDAMNCKKHKKKNGEGLSFGEAEEVFDDEFYQERYDFVNSKIGEPISEPIKILLAISFLR